MSRFPEHLFFRTHLNVLKSIEFMWNQWNGCLKKWWNHLFFCCGIWRSTSNTSLCHLLWGGTLFYERSLLKLTQNRRKSCWDISSQKYQQKLLFDLFYTIHISWLGKNGNIIVQFFINQRNPDMFLHCKISLSIYQACCNPTTKRPVVEKRCAIVLNCVWKYVYAITCH